MIKKLILRTIVNIQERNKRLLKPENQGIEELVKFCKENNML